MFQVSLAARQLINALLQRDPVRRLGSNTGASEIKGHPFSGGINWPLIRCMVVVDKAMIFILGNVDINFERLLRN